MPSNTRATAASAEVMKEMSRFLVEQEFAGRTDRWELSPEFLDQAPDGFASALSFFSDDAFRYYLPAYLIADIDNKLECVTPQFHLYHGLDDRTRSERINPRRYGTQTWWDCMCAKFQSFTREQADAVVQYLEWRRDSDNLDVTVIEQALTNYWRPRAAGQDIA